MSVIKKLLGNANWTTYTGRLHVGIDTLARPAMMSLVDDVDYRVHEQRLLPERPEQLIGQMREAGSAIADVVVLARRHGYDLVDRIAAAGFNVHRVTPAELQRYAGIRNVNEKHDAYWMAHLLRAGALPLGEVYWAGELRDVNPHPRVYRAQMPSMSSRLKVKLPRGWLN